MASVISIVPVQVMTEPCPSSTIVGHVRGNVTSASETRVIPRLPVFVITTRQPTVSPAFFAPLPSTSTHEAGVSLPSAVRAGAYHTLAGASPAPDEGSAAPLGGAVTTMPTATRHDTIGTSTSG